MTNRAPANRHLTNVFGQIQLWGIVACLGAMVRLNRMLKALFALPMALAHGYFWMTAAQRVAVALEAILPTPA